MKLKIENFAKIKNADIIIDGITVIAGENNTGKSTVGKVLFSLFNSLSDIDEKIREERIKEIEITNRDIIQRHIDSLELSRASMMHATYSLAKQISGKLYKRSKKAEEVSKTVICDIVEDSIEGWRSVMKSAKTVDWTELEEAIYFNTKEIWGLPQERIVKEIVSRYFNSVFHNQIQSLSDDQNREAVLTLEIKGKKDKLYFSGGGCREFADEINLIHKAIYIDNPFVVDELSKYNNLNPMNQFLKDLLIDDQEDGIMDGIIESVLAKDKLAVVFDALSSVVQGEIVADKKDEFYLKSSDFERPVSVNNLSTGMKSFVILKMLLEKGCLKNKDVVILDEPEIHLHPQWQIAYAELIVLLQKHFDLSVIVTTHSPYFVDALNLFSCKHGTEENVNFYLSSNQEQGTIIECVTENIDLVYKKMASPIQMLDTLRYELNNG